MHPGLIDRRAVLLAALLGAGCAEFPRDPEGTLRRVRGGRLRVGLTEQPPWTVRAGAEPAGAEVELVRRLAAELNATPEWIWGGEQRHMEALERYNLDLVGGGLTDDTPWKNRVGLTAPYFEDRVLADADVEVRKHVMAVPPGENAWLMRVEEFLRARGGEVQELLQREAARP